MSGREDIFQKAMNDGHSAAWDQEWDKAVAAYRQALQEFPDHPKALNSLGLALYQLGRFEEALQTYINVAKISSDDPVPMEKVAQLSERIGDLKMAVDAALRAGDLFLKQRDTEKALENWVRVTNISPENAVAHSRLAQVHEKLGHPQQAVTEYLAIASILQRAGNIEKTKEMVNKALSLLPNSIEARQADSLLKGGQLLPKPLRGKGGTGPIRMAQVKELEKPKASSGLDPVAEGRQKALTQLAEMLFEFSDDSPSAQERKGISAIMRGTGGISLQQSEQTKVVMHLGMAIDAQTKGNEAQAAEELEAALEAGFAHPSLYYVLGLLRFKGEKLESAQRYLQNAIKHNDYALGTRLLLGQLFAARSQLNPAALEYLEALKIADSVTVPVERADEISQQYEPLIEANQNQQDDAALRKICDNVSSLLMRSDWREQLFKMRDQMPKQQESDMIAPLADVILQAQSSTVLESMTRVNQLARTGNLRSAMDEAYYAMQHAPTYLPLHMLMGDLLVQEKHDADAIVKYSIVAHAYSVRGEAAQATKILRRIIQLAPMDLGARNRLIDQLIARGQVDDAIREYLELAAIYYRLADLNMARKTYTTALRVVQQGNADREWNAHILQRMADIDLQRLDWKQALRVYEQIRTIAPDDSTTRRQLVELNLRMAQTDKAMQELENYTTHLESQNKNDVAVLFIEDLLKEHPEQPLLKRAFAMRLHQAGRTEEAISVLDTLGETLMQTGNKQAAIEVITQIVMMNPPNAEDYRRLLLQMQSS
ncbi:MAG: tetratricopeptide repeat protein [Chloroflexi bacterium]|nr:tetratricopeptide repeat protein [Chloroflexota bacterium]